MEWPAGTRFFFPSSHPFRLIIAFYLFYLHVCTLLLSFSLRSRNIHASSRAEEEDEKEKERREKGRERERGKGRERERDSARRSYKSKFHFNVLTKDQIKHFNWRFYGGRQPKSNSCLHPAWPAAAAAAAALSARGNYAWKNNACTHTRRSPFRNGVVSLFLHPAHFIFLGSLPRDQGKSDLSWCCSAFEHVN